MLQARSRSGKLITPAMFPREKIPLLKKDTYYCPVCKGEVILRAGERVIAHFAHVKSENCPVAGGEGVYHERGKLTLFQWLRKQGIPVELEKYLPEIQQRPDLLFRLKTKTVAIEYQCSIISHEEILNRTNGYRNAGIYVLWLLGEKLMRRRGSQSLYIDSFTQTAIHKFNPNYPLTLFYFCPINYHFIKFQDFTFTRKNYASGKLTVNHLHNIKLKDLLKAEFIHKPSFATIWKQEKKRFRLMRRARLYGMELKWRRWLYEKGLHLEQLPSVIHLPVPSSYLLKYSNWIWQSWLVLDIILPRPIDGLITLEECIRRVRRAMVPENHFPLIETSTNPILEYIHLLCTLGILEQISNTSFKKLKNILIHEKVEIALQEDYHLIDQLFQKN